MTSLGSIIIGPRSGRPDLLLNHFIFFHSHPSAIVHAIFNALDSPRKPLLAFCMRWGCAPPHCVLTHLTRVGCDKRPPTFLLMRPPGAKYDGGKAQKHAFGRGVIETQILALRLWSHHEETYLMNLLSSFKLEKPFLSIKSSLYYHRLYLGTYN